MYISCDTAKLLKTVILPKRVILLVDQLPKIFLSFSTFSETFLKLESISPVENQTPKACTLFGDHVIKEVVKYWANLNYKEEYLDFINTYIWQNSLIRTGNAPPFYSSWLKAGETVLRIFPTI